MRAHTNTTTARRRRNARRRRALALGLGICALVTPGTASADPSVAPKTKADAIGQGLEESNQSANVSGYSSVNSVAPPASEPSGSNGSASVDEGYSSLNAMTGTAADAPTVVSGSPSSGDGFDWPSALVGAGTALAVAALGGVALLTARRRTTISPSASTG